MLNLAGFNSTIYSFNNKTWVSLTTKSGSPSHYTWIWKYMIDEKYRNPNDNTEIIWLGN